MHDIKRFVTLIPMRNNHKIIIYKYLQQLLILTKKSFFKILFPFLDKEKLILQKSFGIPRQKNLNYPFSL